MSALFACTRCHGRYPFEDLSASEQICKDCRNECPLVKCTYCRGEFQQEKNYTSTICKRCAQDVNTYGKPKACEYCNITAAFVTKLCRRCASSEKKHGPPATCSQCKQQSAFPRPDENTKLDGKKLCWLCTVSYKKVIAKAKDKKHSSTPPSNTASVTSLASDILSNLTKTTGLIGASDTKDLTARSAKSRHSSHHGERVGRCSSSPHKSRSDSRLADRSLDVTAPTSKKARVDNGFTAPKSSESSLLDPASTENMIAVTQLREEAEALKRQLQRKDQLLLEKDKQLTELKAKNFEAEKELRGKVSALQREHSEAFNEVQSKNRELQKELAVLRKKVKKPEKAVDKLRHEDKKVDRQDSSAGDSPASS